MLRIRCPRCAITLELDGPVELVCCPSCGQKCRLPAQMTSRAAAGSDEVDLNAPMGRGSSASRSRSSASSKWDREERSAVRSRARKRSRRDEPEEQQEYDGSSTAWLIPFILLLGAVGLVSGIGMTVLFVLHDGGVTSIFLGAGMMLLGLAWVVGRAAEDGEAMAVVLIPGYSILYTVRNLDTCGMATFVQFVGGALFGIGMAAYELNAFPQAAPSYSYSSTDTPTYSTQPTPRPPEDMAAATIRVQPARTARPAAAPASFPGLLAAWSFDDGEGGAIKDTSGNGHQATLIGGKYVDGVRGKAVLLNGTSDYFDYGWSPRFSFDAHTAFSIAGWFQTQSDNGEVLAQRNSLDASSLIRIWIEGGSVRAQVRQDDSEAGQPAEIAGRVVNDGQWHHFVLTRRVNGEVELFIDTLSQGKSEAPDAAGSITTDLRAMGSDRYRARKGEPAFFTGCIDELGIYDRVLNADEIGTLAGQ